MFFVLCTRPQNEIVAVLFGFLYKLFELVVVNNSIKFMIGDFKIDMRVRAKQSSHYAKLIQPDYSVHMHNAHT